ncbi:FkbM family methyltransferase [Kineothrix alysoides]|uniref:FkbM family methyltransferase n=1 Tax=Kineothrix alysoides TaxID=1469948 RepID=A0A4V2QBX7_9FIRM|nr:FkbM family methyltransferase [Kineothrix alysoides]TCL58117.1 FkbM family methyltransferase [Kineothrix alysoides]
MAINFQDSIGKIYKHLGDDESRRLYVDRLSYSLTNDTYYLKQMFKRTDLYRKIYDILKSDDSEKYIFGIGLNGKTFADIYEEFHFKGFVDNYVHEEHENLPVISAEEYIEKYANASIYISSTKYTDEMHQQLADAGVNEEKIKDIGKLVVDVWNRQQYFDLPYLKNDKEEPEVFVDGGCFDGSSSVSFSKWAGEAPAFIYAFEPDSENIKICNEVLSSVGSINHLLFSKGLWSSECDLRFSRRDNGIGSRVESDGEIVVPVTSLDSIINDKVTFLKLDVEGAEYEALKGSEKLIKKYKPKLAVCIYHKKQDVWEIPELILSMNEEYKLYVRHYSFSDAETVIYAI